MEDIDRLARLTVGRLCLYAVVAIAAVMAALSYNPRLAFHVGGILALCLALLLVFKANAIGATPARPRDLPGFAGDGAHQMEHHLRAFVVAALREAYFVFASRASAIAGGLLCVSLALSLLL